MVSLPEELQAQEAATRRHMEELQVMPAELAVRLERAREDLSRVGDHAKNRRAAAGGTVSRGGGDRARRVGGACAGERHGPPPASGPGTGAGAAAGQG